MIGEIVLENVARYRAIASLCRQTAAFRPSQKSSLLQQAEHWERLALSKVEAGLDEDVFGEEPLNSPADPPVETRWWLPRREGLFANLAS